MVSKQLSETTNISLGLFFRPCAKGSIAPWEDAVATLDLSWKSDIKSIFDDYTDRTPGSFVEVKEVNLTWHYRNADPDFGEYQKKELLLHLNNLPGLPIDILIGKKAVEIRPQGVNKGSVVRRILTIDQDFDFILCIGDDKTDEDMFEELKKYDKEKNCYTVMIDKKPTTANYYLDNQQAAMELLHQLASIGEE
jgi:trehalose 6-phosphate synthase/phosphatase